MDHLMLNLFICIAVPILLSLKLLEKKSRQTVGFLVIGMTVCLYISFVNGFLLSLFDNVFFVTTTITPVTEELAKAVPVLIFAFLVSDDRKRLLTVAAAAGMGFAVMENVYLIAGSTRVSLFWALARAFGAGLMHSLCTAAVGYGISFVRKKKKLFYTGTFALLTTAIIYHATYNLLVQSQLPVLGFLFPVAAYLPLCIIISRKRKAEAKAEQAVSASKPSSSL